MHKEYFRAGIIGATGYTGQELLGLIARHPRLRLGFATSEAEAGRRIPGHAGTYVSASQAPLGEVDVVFSCLPTGESGPWARRAAEAGVLSIDLSADLREPGSGATYGLPELWREEIRSARLIANPGCYPTGVLLSLAPAVSRGLVDKARPIVIDAASGVTGAGRSARRDLLFGEVSEDYRAYGVGNCHRHVPEMRHGLSRLNGGAPSFIFTPHLLPVRRGILETIYLPLASALPVSDAVEIWRTAYAGEPFVEVLDAGELPTLRDVAYRNSVVIGFSEVKDVEPPTLIVFAAFDNLVKGAAGQALQNANLVLGLEETLGLA